MTGRVLIVDDVPTNRLILRARLTQAYYDVIEAENGEQALEMARAETPDIVLLDVLMPGMDGFEVCQRLKACSDTAHLPVVMLTALDKREDRVQGLQSGADDFLTKPFEDVALMSRVSSLIRTKRMVDEIALRGQTIANLRQTELMGAARANTFGDCTVLSVIPNPAQSSAIAEILRTELECRVECAESIETAQDIAEFLQVDAVIIDHSLPEDQALRLGTAIHAHPQTRHAAILLIAPKSDVGMAAQALDLGFSDYMTAPVDMVELIARMRSALRRKNFASLLRQMVRTTMAEAVTDPLTGTYNRRYASSHLDALIDQCRTKGSPLSLMMLDLDRFKSINDRYGHQGGDDVLRVFAERLQSNVRVMDLVARMGGEEFMVVMPDAQPGAAHEIAERVRMAVEVDPFILTGHAEPITVTVSVGLAELQAQDTVFELIQRADQALYQSKNSGRNKVTQAA